MIAVWILSFSSSTSQNLRYHWWGMLTSCGLPLLSGTPDGQAFPPCLPPRRVAGRAASLGSKPAEARPWVSGVQPTNVSMHCLLGTSRDPGGRCTGGGALRLRSDHGPRSHGCHARPSPALERSCLRLSQLHTFSLNLPEKDSFQVPHC